MQRSSNPERQLDAVPENFQSGERYERAEEIAELLSDASDGLDEVMQKLRDVLE